MVPVDYYVILSAILFSIGVAGVVFRRNALIVFMSIELMLNSANLALIAFDRNFEIQDAIEKIPHYQPFSGQIFVFFVIAVAAAEVAVGLALIVEIFKSKHSIDVDQMNSMKG
jgi:NADH-quinone oxidoreductase subunit K